MPLNIPNTLTWARIALIPIFVGVFYLPDGVLSGTHKNLVSTAIFIVAAVTDWFDGYLARSLGQTSAFGAFLDPVADKLMVAAALILLVQLGRTDAIFAVIIIGREITISALREWMAQVGKSASVAVAYVGKLKTAAQPAGDKEFLKDAFPEADGLGVILRRLRHDDWHTAIDTGHRRGRVL